ncbi:hypothetical protein FB451DRAFT_1194678 [Mycena latifolia]|nr:hypothetical protein FB451DRAFT_1194678 [Mycena latifolia]
MKCFADVFLSYSHQRSHYATTVVTVHSNTRDIQALLHANSFCFKLLLAWFHELQVIYIGALISSFEVLADWCTISMSHIHILISPPYVSNFESNTRAAKAGTMLKSCAIHICLRVCDAIGRVTHAKIILLSVAELSQDRNYDRLTGVALVFKWEPQHLFSGVMPRSAKLCYPALRNACKAETNMSVELVEVSSLPTLSKSTFKFASCAQAHLQEQSNESKLPSYKLSSNVRFISVPVEVEFKAHSLQLSAPQLQGG